MKKNKLADRLHTLNGGREHYQTFLRNLTPQVLLLTFAFLLWAKLDFNRFDSANWQPTLAFFVLIAAFLATAWINISNLYRNYTIRFDKWQRRVGKILIKYGLTVRQRVVAKASAVWKRKFVELVEILLITFFLQVALAIVIVSAIQSASAILRATHV